MIAFSGLFFPVASLPRPAQLVAQMMPMTHAVSLMRGLDDGSGWTGQGTAVGALLLIFTVCTAASTKTFRWE
jgi:ABC-type multidrug transport system permease subunit